MNDNIEARKAAAQGAPTPPNADGTPSNGNPAEPTPDGTVTNPPAASPTSPPQSDRTNDASYWQERFRVMQGINDRMRADHAAALSERDRKVSELTQRIEGLEQQHAAAPPAAASSSVNLTEWFNADQIDRFGEEQCKVFVETALKAARGQLASLVEQEVKPLKERVQKADDDEAEARKRDQAKKTGDFYAALSKAVPTWQEINAGDDWLEWLDQNDKDGEKRQARLDRHHRVLNVTGVANVFRDFIEAKGKAPEPPIAPSRGAGPATHVEPPKAAGNKGYPSREELRDYTKRSATIRNPRDPRFVTNEERTEMEARLRLPRPGA